MHAHDLLIYQCHERHVVETIVKRLPEADLVPPFDLIEKAINTRDSLTFVVASQDNDRLWVPNFECEQKAYDFTALLASVDVVTHEQVAHVIGDDVVTLVVLVFVIHFLKHVNQIYVLAVQVSEYFNWSFELNERFLVFEAFLSLFDQELYHFDWKVYVGHTLGVLGFVLYDLVVEVVNDHVHDESGFALDVLLRNVRETLLKLSTPYLLNFFFILIILLRPHVLGTQSVQLLLVSFVRKALLHD